MEKTAEGYIPKADFLAGRMAKMSAFAHEDIPAYVLHEHRPLLDSADMTPADWVNIARDINDHYDEYDGFIVLHGTDTMAYTASALSFMLENLAKPVILTGSQVPLVEAHTDARENLITAMLLAGYQKIPEVCIYFNNCLLRGNRARKYDAQSFSAFSSPNYPILADVGSHIVVHQSRLLPSPSEAFALQEVRPSRVAYQRVFPGFDASFLEKLLEPPLQALVLETYGIGNAPGNDPALLRALMKARDHGILVINSTQCDVGYVDMSGYATGQTLQAAGVLGAGDMTPETILGKLSYLFNKYNELDKIKAHFVSNLRGELSVF